MTLMMVEDDQSIHSLFSSRGGTERDSTYDVQFTVTRVLILCLCACVCCVSVCVVNRVVGESIAKQLCDGLPGLHTQKVGRCIGRGL